MSVNIPITSRPRVVIIGGGFGGLELAKRLKKIEAQIVLIDKNNFHTFQPLLYQVATAALEPDSIAYPLREIFKKQDNIVFRMAEVLKIRPDDRCIETSIGDINYDYLVLSMGTKTNFFGLEDIERNAMRMKSVSQAIELRNIILESFEEALLTESIEERNRLMTFIVVGGGPTGVETAGALGELKKIILPHDYPELNFKDMHIHIIDMEDRLLRMMSREASVSSEKFLSKYEVNIWLNTKVSSYDGKTAVLSNGKNICSGNLIWAAGVTGATIPGLNPQGVLPNNRIKVDEHNKVDGYENIYAIGDIAVMMTPKTPHGHPQLAPVAVQQARTLASNLNAKLGNKPMRPFHYRSLGVMATVGRNHAVVDLPFVRFQGVFGWFVWLFVHLMSLVGFRNKVVAFVNWAWNYFSYDRGLRLIIRPVKR